MITAVVGQNNFLMQRERQRLVADHVQQYGDLGLEVINVDEVEPAAVYDAVTNLPFLTDKKLVVLRSPSSVKAVAESLPDWLQTGDQRIDVLILEPNIDKRTVWYKWLLKSTALIAAEPLPDRQLSSWAQDYARQLGVGLTIAASRMLVDRAGSSQEQLARELEKLSLVTANIDVAEVEELVEPLPSGTVFDLLDDLSRQQPASALQRYRQLLRQKVDASEVLGLMVWQLTVWSKLVAARRAGASDLAAATKLHPYVVQKNSSLIGRMTAVQLDGLLDAALDAERSIKWRGNSADRVVETLILQFGQILS